MADIDTRMLDRRPQEGCVFHANWDTGRTRDLIFGATPTNGSAVTFGRDASGYAYAEGPGTNSANNSITFPDRDEYSVNDPSTVDTSHSMSAWFYLDAVTLGDKIATIISKATAYNTAFEWQFIAGAGAGNALGLPQASNIRHALAPGLSAITAYSSANPSFSAWHHIVATYTGNESSSGFTMYIDGALVSTTKTGSYTGSVNGIGVLRIMGVSSGQCMDGKVSKILLFKRRILTAADVAQLYVLGPNN